MLKNTTVLQNYTILFLQIQILFLQKTVFAFLQKVLCQHPSNNGKMSQKVASITIRPLKRSAFPCTKNRNTQNRFCTFCKKFSVNILQITAKCRKKLQPYKKISCKHHNTPVEKVSLSMHKKLQHAKPFLHFLQKVLCQHPSNNGKMSQKVATVQKISCKHHNMPVEKVSLSMHKKLQHAKPFLHCFAQKSLCLPAKIP